MIRVSEDTTGRRNRPRRWPKPGPPEADESVVWADRGLMVMWSLALVILFRAHTGYLNAIWAAAAASGAVLVAWPVYRRHVLARFRALWADVNAVVAVGCRSQVPWIAGLVLVMAPAALLYLSNKQQPAGADSRPVVLAAISLMTRGDSNLDEFAKQGYLPEMVDPKVSVPYFFIMRNGHIYSRYPGGMVPFALPVVAASRLVGGRLDMMARARLERITAAVVTSASLGLFFMIALHLAPARTAFAVTWLLAVGSAFFSTVAQGLWQHDGLIVWSLIVLLVEFHSKGRPSAWGTVVQGLACGMMPGCRLTAATFLIPYGLWVLLRSPRRALLLVTVAMIAWLPWVAGYMFVYGSPLGPSSELMAGSYWTSGVWEACAGLLLSPARGLLVYQPWLVLAALGLVPAIERAAGRAGCPAGPRGWPAFCAAAFGLHWALLALWGCWWGGWCWGSRLMSEAIPLCALLTLRPIAALDTTRLGRRLVFALGLAAVLTQLPGVYGTPFRWERSVDINRDRAMLWSWSRAPFLWPLVEKPGTELPGKVAR